MKKKLEELNLLDDFLFGTLISHPIYGERFVKILIKTILNRDIKILKIVPQMEYDDGALNLFLYTRGKTGVISQELMELLQYLENTTWINAVNEPLREVQSMVDNVKCDKEVSISYMKSYERDWMMRNEGRAEGLTAGKVEDIRTLLSDLGPIPENITAKIENETNLATLRHWLKLAARAKSLEEFAKQLS